MSTSFDRRKFMGAALGGGAVLAASAAGLATFGPRLAPAPHRAPEGFRFVHMTDLHLHSASHGYKGVVRALKRVNALHPRPDFIQLGGDNVMDVLAARESDSIRMLELFRKVMTDHTDLPVRYCLGNHDIFGWNAASGADAANPLYGKAMAAELWGVDKPYYAFDHKGWRFYVLDNIQQVDPPRDRFVYEAAIDEEQWAWLQADLAAKDPATPAVVTCHVPILSVTLFHSRMHRFADDAFSIRGSHLCQKPMRLADLFSRHNVRLNLSGHTHYLDRVDYNGVTYICDGSICGAWWGGMLDDLPEGFGVVDVRPDGSFDHTYFNYGWSKRMDQHYLLAAVNDSKQKPWTFLRRRRSVTA